MKKSESRACDIMNISFSSFLVIELNIYHLSSFEITLQSKSLTSIYFPQFSLIPPTFPPVIYQLTTKKELLMIHRTKDIC